MIQNKQAPSVIDIEELIIGSIMLDKECYFDIAEHFNPSLFYSDKFRMIAEAIFNLKNRSEPCDMVMVTKELIKMKQLDFVGGAYYVSQLTSRIVTGENIVFHMKLLLQAAIKRDVIQTGQEMINDAYNESSDVFDVIDNAGKKVTALTNKIVVSKVETISSLFNKSVLHNDKLITQKGLAGVPSGFERMDSVTGGFQKADLIILAARPSMGKTALMLSYSRNASVEFKKPVAIFSLEMSALQLMARLQSQETGMPLEKYLRIGLDEVESISNMEHCSRLINSSIFIDDTPSISVFELRNKARKLKRDYGIEAIYIDYLQLMSGGGKFQNKEAEVSYISRSLKALAKELDIPVIALAQLSRGVEARGGEKIPSLADLRDSGAIEQDADLIQFLYRPEYYGIMEDSAGNSTIGKAYVLFGKHRNGSLDKIPLNWEGSCTKFTNIAQQVNALKQPKSNMPNADMRIEGSSNEIVHT